MQTLRVRPRAEHHEGFRLEQSFRIGFGTTAASSTAGCVINALSTSKGDTQIPDTLNMSSLRPQKV